jgi:translation initiation factor 1
MLPCAAGTDTFDDGGDGEQTLVKDGAKSNYVHIRIQQRNGRKSLTTVQGLAIDLDLRKILKALKKVS